MHKFFYFFIFIVLIFSCKKYKDADFKDIKYINSSSALEAESNKYNVYNLVDGTLKCWSEGVKGDGIGESVEIVFDKKVLVYTIYIKNGISRDFFQNNRVKELDINGQTVFLPDTYSIISLNLNKAIITDKLVFTIKSVYKGSKWDDTCITEIIIGKTMYEANYNKILSEINSTVIINENTGNYFVPEKMNFEGETAFYPIGFSKDGYFAFLDFYNLGGSCGFCPVFNLAIQSLITDEKAIEQSLGDVIDQANYDILPIETIWEKNKILIEEKLNQYQIIQQNVWTIMGLNFSYKNNDYSVTINNQYITDRFQGFEAPERDQEFLDKSEIFLYSSKGYKSVYYYERKFPGKSLTDITLGNVIISPYEERAFIIAVAKELDNEGMGRSRINLIGANLKDNFKTK